MRTALAAVAALLLLFAGTACTRVPRSRTLPNSVKNVYVPMVVNRTAEPALEERLTQFMQEEILADGRLNLSKKKNADAVIEVELRHYERGTFDTSPGDFATTQRAKLDGVVKIVRNIPGRPKIGGTRNVHGDATFNYDIRSTTFVPEPDYKDELLRSFAREFIREVMTGEYEDEDDVIPELEATAAETTPAESAAAAAPG